MGDIADIEKKKSMGISNLILGSRGLPIRQKEGGINQEVIFRLSAKASTILGTRPQFILLTDSSKSKKKSTMTLSGHYCANHFSYYLPPILQDLF